MHNTFPAILDYLKDDEGSEFEIQVNGKPSGVTGVVEKTASWLDYHVVNLKGSLELSPGVNTIRIAVSRMPGGAVMNLKTITLQPE